MKKRQKRSAKVKKLFKWLSRWFNSRERRKAYIKWLEVREKELAIQSLILQIRSLSQELEERNEERSLDKHVHKWKHKRGYVH